MMSIVAIVLGLVFASLAAIHFMWASGVQWGLEAAIPTDPDKEPALRPSPFITCIVGMALLLIAVFYFWRVGMLSYAMPNWLLHGGGWGIPILFTLRAMGDFNYVGFFKRVRQTTFAKYDTRYFSPLCVVIATLGLILQVS